MNGTSPLLVLVAAVLTNNILLAGFLGMCSFLACSARVGTALGLGAAVTFVMTCTAVLDHAIYWGVLAPGAPLCAADLTHLTLVVFISVIAAFVQFVEMFIERVSPRLHCSLGIFLPLITVNCAILGTSLFAVMRKHSLAQAAAFGLGSGLGWALAIVLMAGLRQKMGYGDVPGPFRGVAITMIATGVMAMAFMGFAGMAAAR